MSTKGKVIGKVSATEKNPSTIDFFYFWMDSNNDDLSPFDVVMVENHNKSITYAIVEEINHVTDSSSHFASYISSEFGSLVSEQLQPGNTNRLSFSYVKAKVVHNTENSYTPVMHDSPVCLCTPSGIREALGLNEVKNPLTCGYMEMYGNKVKVDINDKFLIGPDGAHLNVSGISGLACKTSYTMFLMNALQQKYRKLWEISDPEDKPQKIAYLIFNVKGRDLLTLDVPNDKLTEKQKKVYTEDLGLKAAPFKQVYYYYPYGNRPSRSYTQSNADQDDIQRQFIDKNACRYFYNFESCRDKLQYLFANEPDQSGTLESIISHILDYGQPFDKSITTWKDFYNVLNDMVNKGGVNQQSTPIALSSWKKFARIVKKFQSEAQSAAMLTHPNIVNVYDVAEDRGLHYIVMELVEGITLKEQDKVFLPLTLSLERVSVCNVSFNCIKVSNTPEGKDTALAGTAKTITANSKFIRNTLADVLFIYICP